MRTTIHYSIKLLALICIFSLSEHDLQAQDFTSVETELGIDKGFGIPGIFDPSPYGGGISFSDINNDGWDDLTIGSQNGDPLHIYLNQDGLAFTPLSTNINSTCHHKQILWVDIDNDSDKDLYINCYEGQNKLFKNNGNYIFSDVTSSSGLLIDAASPSTTATFGDYDRDGDLDLYVGNYSNIGSNYFDNLYQNNGNFTFTDVTTAVGLPLAGAPSLASSFQDIDHDLNPELYIAVDKVFENLMYKNNGDGSYSDIGSSSGTDIIVCAMNSSSGDIDADGDLDIYVTNGPAGNVLLRNNGDETFTDITTTAGVAFNRIGWATNFFDIENDGDQDMYVAGSGGAKK